MYLYILYINILECVWGFFWTMRLWAGPDPSCHLEKRQVKKAGTDHQYVKGSHT